MYILYICLTFYEINRFLIDLLSYKVLFLNFLNLYFLLFTVFKFINYK